jgi:hypothetical protein
MSPEFTMDAACRTILGKPWQEISEILRAHQTSEQLAEIGFDKKLLHGPEEVINFKVSFAPPNAFNHDATKKAITDYRYLKMWVRKASI